MAHIEFCVADYLHEVPVGALREEVESRIRDGKWTPVLVQEGVEAWTAVGMAEDIRAAYYARNASRLEMLLCKLEAHESLDYEMA